LIPLIDVASTFSAGSAAELISTREAIALFDCGRSHFFAKILKEGLLTPIRYGPRRMRFRRTDVESLKQRGYY